MNRGKALLRAGTITVLVGFFLPTLLVSCTGSAATIKSFSLSELAALPGYAGLTLLYLLLLGAGVTLVLSFLKASDPARAMLYLWVQLGAMIAGTLGVLLPLLNLSSQISQGSMGLFQVQPGIGVFVLVLGEVLFVLGWLMERGEALGSGLKLAQAPPYSPAVPSTGLPPPPLSTPTFKEHTPLVPTIRDMSGPSSTPLQGRFPDSAGNILAGGSIPTVREPSLARLEVLEGDLEEMEVPIYCDNFTIGRSSDNMLRLEDTTVSRHHARLRSANGEWFIQDAGSSGGTFVNDEKVPAMRLQSGDEIRIGNNRFTFYC